MTLRTTLLKLAAAASGLTASVSAFAADTLDKGDTAWMLVATVLVLFMTIPGIALFYAGMARKKNILGTIAQDFAICGVVTILWFVIGYSLAFSEGNSFIGGLSFLGMQGIGVNTLQGSIPQLLFAVFQMTFAVLTACLITGSWAGRVKFSAMLAFMVVWSLAVYAPICHWVWASDGFFFKLGALDYAGGTVVHINAGIAGLVGALMLGKRKGYGVTPMQPANLTIAVIGAAVLWVGWMGFKGGSRGGRASRDGDRGLPDRGGRRSCRLDGSRMGVPREAFAARHDFWRDRGSCRHHSGVWLCGAASRPRDRYRGRSRLLLVRHDPEAEAWV